MKVFYVKDFKILEGEIEKETDSFYYINGKRKKKTGCFKNINGAYKSILTTLGFQGIEGQSIINLRETLGIIIDEYPELFL